MTPRPNLDVRTVTLAHLLGEVVLGIAERDRVSVSSAEMLELIKRMAHGLREEQQRFELAERLRDAADVIEHRCPAIPTKRPAEIAKGR